MTVQSTYKRLRSKGWRAAAAMHNARTLAAWNAAGGYVKDGNHSPDPDDAPIRLRIEPDMDAQWDADDKEFARRADREGVWGIIGEYWNGEQWVHADSCWGFLGDDLQDNGYDTDIMASTVEQWLAVTYCPTCKRPNK